MLAGPIVLIGFSIAQDGRDLAAAANKWFRSAPEQAPSWMGQVPVIGSDLTGYWSNFAEDRNRWMDQLDKEVAPPRPKIVIETEESTVVEDAPPLDPVDIVTVDDKKTQPTPHIVVLLGKFLVWAKSGLIGAGFAVGQGVTQILLSAFIAFFLLKDAEILSKRLSVVADRLAGERGKHLLKVAGNTVRGDSWYSTRSGVCGRLGVLDCWGTGSGSFVCSNIFFRGDSIRPSAHLAAGIALAVYSR